MCKQEFRRTGDSRNKDFPLHESIESQVQYLDCAFAKLVEILKSRNLIDSSFCFLTHEQRLEECEKIIDQYINRDTH